MIATKPANVWTNSAGQAVPTRYVPTRDKRATRLVARHIKAAGAMATRLAALRQAVLNDVEDFVAWSAEASGIKAAGGRKGNVDLTSFDGLAQIRLRKPEYIEFDERLQQAKALIDQFLAARAKGDVDKALISLITAAFTTTRDGQVRADAVLSGQRRVKIDDPIWRRAMELIEASKQSIAAKTYIRFYSRPDTETDWTIIPLDIANA